MANYPSYPVLDTSSVSRVDGYVPVRASNGTLKVRKMMAGEKREFTVEHFLTRSERDTLETFFQNNKTADVTLYWPGEAGSFTVRFVAAPAYYATQGAWYRVQVKLAQV